MYFFNSNWSILNTCHFIFHLCPNKIVSFFEIGRADQLAYGLVDFCAEFWSWSDGDQPIFDHSLNIYMLLAKYFLTTYAIYYLASIFQMQYYLSIVDGSLTLLLGLPASFIFMHYANCRLIAVEIKQRIKIISECSSYSDYLPLDRSTIGKEYIDDPQAKSFRNYSNEVSWTKLMITSNN